ncbi:MAG: thiamine phosphate synthase [Variibacter sp.]|nr:thiamine phosphate synthase [Variibacter sp.]
MMPLPSPPLLLVTNRRQASAPLDEILAAAFAAGCRWASVREKDLPAEDQIALARRLLPLAQAHGARLTLHGSPAWAKEAGLGGVHLSAHSDAAAARALLGPGALVGLSVHGVDDVRGLDPAALDYVLAGPAYPTSSKPGYGPFLGPEGIARIASATVLPVLAIGGIGPENAAELLAAGAAGLAVMGGIMQSADPAAAVAALLAAFERHRP